MAFTLNRKKNLDTSVELWKDEHIVGNEFVTIVSDVPLTDNPTKEKILSFLKSILEKAGVTSYVITSAVSKIDEVKLKKLGKTDYYNQFYNGWFEQIVVKARQEGKKADVVIPFGPAMYQITKTANDFIVQDLIYPAFENYFYAGTQTGNWNCFVFPQYSIREVFTPGSVSKIELGGWRMNFLVTVLRKIAAHQYDYPEDMSDVELKEIGENYTSDKEGAVKEVEAFLRSHFNSEVCAFDLETSGFYQWKDRIRCITLAFDSTTGYYLEWKIFSENPELIKLLSEMMLSCKHRVTVNGKFDIKFLWVNGLDLEVSVTDDAMTLSHCICSQRRKGLKSQAWFWTKYGGYDNKLDAYLDSLKAKGIKNPSYYDIPKPILFPYATMDAVITVRVWKAGLSHAKKFIEEYPTEIPTKYTGDHAYTCLEWYDTIMKLYPIICRMEYEGLYLDKEVMDAHKTLFEKRVNSCREKLGKIFNVKPSFDFGSTKQLGQLLEKAGWDCHGRASDGGFATDKGAFCEWARDKQEGVQELTDFRKANICLKTYIGDVEKVVNQRTGVITEKISGWPQYTFDHEDGSCRIHPNFSVCGTETYRMISREPNLQNVPTHSDEGSITKMAFTVPPSELLTVEDENGKEFSGTDIDAINTTEGYKLFIALTEEDTIVDIGDKTVVEYEEWFDKWKKEGVKPLGTEKL